MIKIEDNFLDQKVYDELLPHFIDRAVMSTTPDMTWIFNDAIDYEGDDDKFQFIHPFYGNCNATSPHITLIDPIIVKLAPMAIYRIKANMITRTPEIVVNEFHMDIGGYEDCLEKLNYWETSVYYINTNDGYTEFEDGTKVESVANRMITFPSKMKHRGTSCTDAKVRIIINFNYFKAPPPPEGYIR